MASLTPKQIAQQLNDLDDSNSLTQDCSEITSEIMLNLGSEPGGFMQSMGANSAQLSKAAVQAMSANQFNILSPDAAKNIQTAFITPFQIWQIGSKDGSFLSKLGINAAGLTQAAIQTMSGPQIALLSNTAVQAMSADQLNWIWGDASRYLSTAAITIDQIQKLGYGYGSLIWELGANAAGLRSEVVAQMSAEQLNWLSPEASICISTSGITVDQIKKVGCGYGSFISKLGANAAGLKPAAIRSMTGPQARMLSDVSVHSMSDEQLNCLSPEASKSLSTRGITVAQIEKIGYGIWGFIWKLGANAAGLAKDVVGAMSFRQLNWLFPEASRCISLIGITVDQIKQIGYSYGSLIWELGANAAGLNNDVVGSMSGRQLDVLSAEASRNLSTSGITVLQIKQIGYAPGDLIQELGANAAGLNNDVVGSMSGRQLDSLSAEATRNLSTSGITADQIRILSFGSMIQKLDVNAAGLSEQNDSIYFGFLRKLDANAAGLSKDAIEALSPYQWKILSPVAYNSIRAKYPASGQPLNQAMSTFNIDTSSSSAPFASNASLIQIAA